VIVSPNPMDSPFSPSTASPAVATTAPTHTLGAIRVRSSTAASSGVSTTYIPVMKPDTLAGVYCKPMVCTICATP